MQALTFRESGLLAMKFSSNILKNVLIVLWYFFLSKRLNMLLLWVILQF